MKPAASILFVALGGCLLVGCARQPPVAEVVDFSSRTPYTNPLISPGMKMGALPPAVQHTVRAQTGGAEIQEIVREPGTATGSTVYRIYFSNARVYAPLLVATDGSVLNPDYSVAVGASRDSVASLTGGASSGLALVDLPPKVVQTIEQRAPEAEVSSITRENRGPDQVVYVISFKGQKHPVLEVNSDGKLVIPAPPVRIREGSRK